MVIFQVVSFNLSRIAEDTSLGKITAGDIQNSWSEFVRGLRRDGFDVATEKDEPERISGTVLVSGYKGEVLLRESVERRAREYGLQDYVGNGPCYVKVK